MISGLSPDFNSLKYYLDILYLYGYNTFMYEIKSTIIFSKWLSKLKDMRGRIAVARRIERMEMAILVM